jgi:hypothetical protein
METIEGAHGTHILTQRNAAAGRSDPGRGVDTLSVMDDEPSPVRAGLSEDEMRATLIRLAFGGDERKLDEFCEVLRRAIPEDTTAVLRGSSITGYRWDDNAPFDADGPGTSDLDLTLVGNDILSCYTMGGFYIPGVHSKPLSDEHPDVAPRLLPLRRHLVEMTGRPVNIQGTRDWVMFVREHVMNQPYLVLFGRLDEPAP